MDIVLSKPVYISSGLGMDNPLTGYTCPTGKRSVIKSITVSNETPGSGYVSFVWQDVNLRGVGNVDHKYPILISGYVSPYGRLRVLDDFIVIEEKEHVLISTLTETTGNFTALFSVIEKDLYPEIVTITPKTVFYQMISNNTEMVYQVPTGYISTIKSISVNNDSPNVSFARAYWSDLNNVGIGSTINDYTIFQSGEIGAYGRFRGLDDILTLKNLDQLKCGYINDDGVCTFLVTMIEEEI